MKKSSLKNKVWLYLFIFATCILGCIWILQIISLDFYYEWSKKSEIKKIGKIVTSTYNVDNYSDILDFISFENDVCIELTNKGNISYSTDSVSRGCLANNSREINKYKFEFMKSGKSSTTYKVINPKFRNKTLIYGLKINNDNYAFISTSLEPISSTVSVLKKQLILIIIIVFILSFIIAYTISKKISKPIEKITNISSKISKGNYDVDFKTNSDIKEINELAEKLNDMTLELSKTESLRRELLANVSHDLKTPLTLIKANAEMIKDFNYKNKEKREKNLNTISDEVDRLNLLVEDILDLSKIQSKALELKLEKINLDELIRNIIVKFSVLCEKEGYKIIYNGFECYIEADKKRIEQVIYNLINNAINYTGLDKTIYINLIEKEDYIRFEVKDTGKGIDKEDLEYIWDKYYKSDKKYKRVTYGTGLGLSIVKDILILHDFEYGVDTKKDIGTTFYFDIKSKKM